MCLKGWRTCQRIRASSSAGRWSPDTIWPMSGRTLVRGTLEGLFGQKWMGGQFLLVDSLGQGQDKKKDKISFFTHLYFICNKIMWFIFYYIEGIIDNQNSPKSKAFFHNINKCQFWCFLRLGKQRQRLCTGPLPRHLHQGILSFLDALASLQVSPVSQWIINTIFNCRQ